MGATAGVISSSDVCEDLWVFIDERVEEAYWGLALRKARIVDESDDTSEGRAGAAGA